MDRDTPQSFRFLEKPLNEVCFIKIKEHVGEKRGTTCTYTDAIVRFVEIPFGTHAFTPDF
jgi:hypothetical protein